MNAKLLLKTILVIGVLLLLVIMGMNNRQSVELAMPPILSKPQRMPAAYMFYGFFGVGFLVGTVLSAGGKRGGAKSKAD